MSDYSNIPLGLKITTQIPLDVKTYIQNEAALKDLGLNNNLAFTYVKGCTFYCIEEGTRYEWREVVGAEVGLRTPNYTYPAGIVAFGITYSNKIYNFFPTEATADGSETKINAGSNISITGTGTTISPYTINGQYSPFERIDEGNGNGYVVRGRDNTFFGNIGADAIDFSYSSTISSVNGATGSSSFAMGDHVIASNYLSTSYGYLVDNNGIGSFDTGFRLTDVGYTNFLTGIGHSVTSMNATVVGQAANIITEQILDFNATTTKALFTVGNGTIENGVGSDFNILTRSDAFIVRMNGLATLPSVTNILIDGEATGKAVVTREYLESKITTSVNLQKTITTSYTLTSGDNNYTIIVDNGVTPINITIPTGLLANIFVGFIQKGTADVTFVASGTTIHNPIGLKSKGQYYNTSIDQEGSTNVYYLLGNTKV